MAMPRPSRVIVLMANVDTVVTDSMARVAVRAPSIATIPTSSGSSAATTLPKMTASSTSTTGSANISPRATSRLVTSSPAA